MIPARASFRTIELPLPVGEHAHLDERRTPLQVHPALA